MYKVHYAPHGHEAYGDAEKEAVVKCLDAGWLAGNGPRTAEFERRVADYFDKRHAVFVNSGSSALELAAAVIGPPPTDTAAIVTCAQTFNTSVAPFVRAGWKIRYCDVYRTSMVPTVEQVMKVVTEHTHAILLPNLAGAKPDWAQLAKSLVGRNIVLIEDSADCMTRTPETDISITSFYASHVITAGGGGGMFMCNSAVHVHTARTLTNWGRRCASDDTEDVACRFNAQLPSGIPYDWKFTYDLWGYNFKATEMQAAFGLVQLDRLPSILAQRARVRDVYVARLQNSAVVRLPVGAERIDWMALPLLVCNSKRAALVAWLAERKIQARVCFAGNILMHPLPNFTSNQYDFPCPGADHWMANGILLGCHHGMTEQDAHYVCDALDEFKQQ